MAEDLSYLRERLDEACNGIARLEEQTKTLFNVIGRHESNQEAHRKEHETLRVDVTTLDNRVKIVEVAKEKGGNRAWEIVMIVVAAIVGIVTGKFWK